MTYKERETLEYLYKMALDGAWETVNYTEATKNVTKAYEYLKRRFDNKETK